VLAGEPAALAVEAPTGVVPDVPDAARPLTVSRDASERADWYVVADDVSGPWPGRSLVDSLSLVDRLGYTRVHASGAEVAHKRGTDPRVSPIPFFRGGAGDAERVSALAAAVEDLAVVHALRGGDTTLDDTKAERFALAKRALGSSVERVTMSVYDLSPERLGSFDLVFCGDLLVHLKDPITAAERIRTVCRDTAIVCTPIIRLRFGRRRALAELDGIENFQWWAFTQPALERLLRAAGFPTVVGGRPFNLPATSGGAWKGLRGVARASV
jgi:hypothetical protein